MKEISAANRSGNALYKLPYRVGITVALVAGFGSFPLVFDLDTAMWFNEQSVTADGADPEGLGRPLEVT